MRNLMLLSLIGGILAGISCTVTHPLSNMTLNHNRTPSNQMHYAITDIGSLGEGQNLATGVNDRGQVTGESDSWGGFSHAFLWTKGRMKDLGVLDRDMSTGESINNRGLITGSCQIFQWTSCAFLYDGRDMVDLGVSGSGNAINSRDQIVGDTEGGAFLYNHGKIRLLGTLGGSSSEAHAINDEGQIVGGARIRSGHNHAFLFRSGKMRDLGTLGGSDSEAFGINSGGSVVGRSKVQGLKFHAFLWKGGTMRDLDAPDASDSCATAINAASEIVGDSQYRVRNIYTHATLWLGGQRIDLNSVIPADSGWILEHAAGINSSGQIVGYGFREGFDYRRGFLLTPITRDKQASLSDGLL
ncbi:MAG: hypothetical protein M3Y56_08980 [Armatimonadota bacterium]|nr:hypothetical protein [Armatimonadota bacterium]